PAQTCAVCPLRPQCTDSPHGRSVSIHPDAQLLAELRERQQTPAGRAALRERVQVEHDLAHIGAWQGDRARYRGQRKNLFDLRRVSGTVRVLKLGPDLSPACVERGGADQGAARRAVPHALATARELRAPAAGVPRAAGIRAGSAVAACPGVSRRATGYLARIL